MRVLCPFCQKPSTHSDSEAGKSVECPECKKTFPAPSLYVSAPIPMEPLAPPPPPVYSTPTPVAPPPLLPTSIIPLPASAIPPNTTPSKPFDPIPPSRFGEPASKSCTLSVSIDVLRRVAPIALTVAFVLTFFSWAGLYPGGHSAYTQGPWRAMFGSYGYDTVAEDVFKMKEGIDKQVRTGWWLLPYIPCLILSLLVAWGDAIVAVAKWKMPAALESLWRYRFAALVALCATTTLLIAIQWMSGFGLHKANRYLAEEAKEEILAAAKTPETIAKAEMTIGGIEGAMRPETTIWLRLAFLAHLIAVAAVAYEAWLQSRGSKPVPTLKFTW
jgi:hypothetical protein